MHAILRNVAAVLLFITLRSGAAPEKLPPLELPVPEAMLTATMKDAYGVYVAGNKSGWALMTLQPGKTEGQESVAVEMHVDLEMKALGNAMQVQITERQQFARALPQRALLLESIQKMDGQERIISLRHKADQTYSAEITEAGKKRSLPDVTMDFRLTHVLSAYIWGTDPARKPGDAIGVREFDEDKMALTDSTITLRKEAEWTGPGGKLPVWEVDLYQHAMKIGVQARMSKADGSLVNLQMAGMFELRREPEAVAKQKDSTAGDIFLALMVKSDKKLGSAAGLKELEVELIAPKGARPMQISETVNQTITASDDRSVTLRITRGGGKPQPAADADRAENLKATLRYPADNEEVKKLAEQAVAGAKDDAEKVKKLLRFTDGYLRDSYDVEALTVMDLLKSRKGECSAHALLFTALARAAGIPAREAGGWLYMDDTYQAFGGHAWNEVILDGHWVPVDAVFRQAQLDAGHIQLHAGEADGKMIEGLSGGWKAKVKSFQNK